MLEDAEPLEVLAAMIAQGMMANPDCTGRPADWVALEAYEVAHALMDRALEECKRRQS